MFVPAATQSLDQQDAGNQSPLLDIHGSSFIGKGNGLKDKDTELNQVARFDASKQAALFLVERYNHSLPYKVK